MEITLKMMQTGVLKKPKDAIKYFKSLGVNVPDNFEDTFETIKKDAFTIAGITKMDRLLAAKELILKAMSEEVDIKVFQKQIKDLLNTSKTHADIIVTQNINNAHNAGRLNRALDDEDDMFPLFRPLVKNDIKTTKICKWLATKKVAFRVDDKLLKLVYPPRHFRCRTIFISITEAQAERYGLKVMAISKVPKQFQNDKKFRKLPNTAYKPDLKKYPKELVTQYKAR